MFARMFAIEGRREQLEEFARAGEENVLPALQRLDGFEGLLVLVNHQNGQILVVTFWERSRWLAVPARGHKRFSRSRTTARASPRLRSS